MTLFLTETSISEQKLPPWHHFLVSSYFATLLEILRGTDACHGSSATSNFGGPSPSPTKPPPMHSGGSRGANPAMAPIEIGNGVWPPFGTERAMEVFGPPYRCRLRIWPPMEKYKYKTQKRSMTKKRSSEILKR